MIREWWKKYKEGKMADTLDKGIQPEDLPVLLRKVYTELHQKNKQLSWSIIIGSLLIVVLGWIGYNSLSASIDDHESVRVINEHVSLLKIDNALRQITYAHSREVLQWGKNWIPYKDTQIKRMANVVLYGEQLLGIEPEEIYAIGSAESHWYMKANSEDDAKGILQILPEVSDIVASKWMYEDIDLYDPVDNLRIGILYSSGIKATGKKHYLNLVGGKWKVEHTAGCWNGGPGYYPGYLRRLKKNKKTVLYPETANFIEKVKYYYSNYKKDPPDYTVIWENRFKTNKVQKSNI